MKSARAFGELPPSAESVVVPDESRVENILELVLLGGISQHESFYVVEEFGQGQGTHWHAFAGSITTQLEACGLDAAAGLMPFGLDAAGRTVSFSPFLAPLTQRADLLQRLRVCAFGHEAAPHEVALPLALAGRAPSSPAMAGLGSHIQRFGQAVEPDREAPSSYVLLPVSAVQAELAQAASATGVHPGVARPLTLRIGSSAEVGQLLSRPTVGSAKEHDALIRLKAKEFEDRLSSPDGQIRANALAEAVATVGAIENTSSVDALLPSKYFEPINGTSCGSSNNVQITRMNLNLAAHLLTAEKNRAKHVCVVDGGFGNQSDAGGYDAHSDALAVTARSLHNTMQALVDVINQPGESAPGKIDLDKTLVMITTEFGRSHVAETNGGRAHWPNAFTCCYLGGPIQAANSGIHGAIAEDGQLIQGSRPVAHRIAALLALGIWPMETEAYNVNDVPEVVTEEDAVRTVVTEQLGIEL